jgi:chemotaxis-related protein WspD
MMEACWQKIGIQGDRSCPELEVHVHCRNCPTFKDAARAFLNREPQADYLDELTGLNTNMSGGGQARESGAPVMVFRVGDEWLALPVRLIDHIYDPAPVRAVPHRGHPGFLGIAAIDGQMELCMSLHAILEMDGNEAGAPPRSARRWLMLMLGGQRWVAPVDEIRGVHLVAAKGLSPVPASLAASSDPVCSGLFNAAGTRVSLLAPDPLLRRFRASLS